jgi:septal ring factor EnvC (AmiA/AmiB activator)
MGKHAGALWTAGVLLAIATTAGAYVPQSGAGDAPQGEREFERMLRSLDAREEALAKEIDELGPKSDIVHKRMLARGRAYYRMVRAGLLPVGGGFDALVDHAAAVERLRAALARDVELLRSLKARAVAAREELRKVRAEKAPLTIQREAMQRAKSVMQQADERRDAFMRAFGGSQPLPHVAIYGAEHPAGAPNATLPELKGRLTLPVTGRAEVQQPTQPGDENKTLRIVTGRDSAVRAIYPGRVVFVGKTHLGDTVVLDHGDNYFTVYGNLHHIEVKLDEIVSEGGRLGWVLRFGTTKPTLLFEIRRGKVALDPATWLGL